jgi:hypothetical protein
MPFQCIFDVWVVAGLEKYLSNQQFDDNKHCSYWQLGKSRLHLSHWNMNKIAIATLVILALAACSKLILESQIIIRT